jgi:sugar phosphate isomerase/epimerase/mono/diheme cytochrome c family protein
LAFAQERSPQERLFARENLVAWCIVPFDAKKRGPEERAAMLKKLGFTRFAYDYRTEHMPTFDAEMEALKRHGIELVAWWFPTTLNDEGRGILEVLRRHKLKVQLWVTGGGEPTKSDEEQRARVKAEAARIRPIAEEAAKAGCSVALYNHGGWFGEPENQLAIIEELKLPNVGIVYNQHHGHDHLGRFPELLKRMLPHLVCLNLNGMMPDGERRGQKILPLGQGELDLALLRTMRESGYRGPIGILGHTQDDAEERLLDNLDGLDWLVKQLDGAPGGPKPKPRTPVPAPPQSSQPKLVPGRFGQALDATRGGLVAFHDERYRQPPLTIECWAKLSDQRGYNILVAHEPKSSATHWELFTMAGTGTLTAYLPGFKPDHVRSEVDVVDDRWHHLILAIEPGRVRLFVDGNQVADETVEFQDGKSVAGELAIGRLPTGEFGCTGLIDDVRISRGLADITAVPTEPRPADDTTIGLWRLDSLDADGSPDQSPLKNAARAPTAAAAPPLDKTPPEHWGRGVIGFDWKEADSVDNRWNQTEIGPFLASIVPIPGKETVAKGLSIKVGDRGQGAVCYDTKSMTMRAGWTGGFLKFDPARYGLINSPQIAGELMFALPHHANWDAAQLQYRGLAAHDNRVVLAADVNGVLVRESPWMEEHDGLRVFTRTLEVAPSKQSMHFFAGDPPGTAKQIVIAGAQALSITNGGRSFAIAVLGDGAQLGTSLSPQAHVGPKLAFNPSDKVRRLKLLYWSGPTALLPKFIAAVEASQPPEDLAQLAKPAKPRWTAEIATRGLLSRDTASPYVVDTLTLPFDNPYKALFFASGHDFFANGDIALCTVHGDVWRVSGVDDKLDRLVWKRFATGLFQPLGLKIVDDHVFVLGRDQITRLVDHNGDGEADEYECFCNSYPTSTGGHDYVTCLETNSRGEFHLVHATEGLLRVPNSGVTYSVVATGFRNPNGMSIGPGDEITVAPQEGEWTPGSKIEEVRPGGHYGYGGPKAGRGPAGHDPPLAFLPRMMDNSSGGQVWVTSERWGTLGRGQGSGVRGQETGAPLMHLSYGKCRMILVLRERVGDVTQGAVIEFPGVNFSSGAMRGRFSPHDGQLYVSGLKGWASAAVDDGCLQRVRYQAVGNALRGVPPVALPVDRQTYANGLAITFSQPLDPTTSGDPGSFHLEQWNYRYSAGYGSPDLKLSDPTAEGHDEVAVRSATLLGDGRTVFLEIPGLKPAHQTSIEYALRTASGRPLRHSLVATTHVVPERRMDESHLRRPELPAEPLVDESSLAPGVLLEHSQGAATNIRTNRLVAWHVSPGQPAAGTFQPGPFDIAATGLIKVPLRGDYAFHLTGQGSARLRINGRLLLESSGDLAATAPASAALRQGYNRLELEYSSPASGTAACRLWWTDGTFAPEPVPPTALWHDARIEALQAAESLRRGAWLVRERRCHACHAMSATDEHSPPTGPVLAGIGSRLEAPWMYRWLLDPHAIRPQAHMPRLFDAGQAADRQAAADIAAYLATLKALEDESPTGSRGSAVASPTPASPLATSHSQPAPSGAALFEDLACVACHRLTPPAEDDKYDRISLAHVRSKFRPGRLVEFLGQPHARYSATRMPDFQLSAEEASALAAHLTAGGRRDEPAAAEMANADSIRGRALFRERQCDACHATSTDPEASKLKDVPLADLTRGCLAGDAISRGKAPAFALSPSQVADLRAVFSRPEPAGRSATSVELLPVVMASHRCGACHNRDHSVAPLRRIVAEESDHGVPPDGIPNLTWTGEKLHSDWTRRLLAGELPYRSRPWLKGRMPAYHAPAKQLADALAAEHGLEISHAPRANSDPQPLAAVGDRLTRKDGGLDCRSCHAVGKDQPTGDERTKIAQGINFAHTRERLREDFYLRFVHDPPRHDVTTRMPKLSADGRTTNAAAILDGDARKQFEAIWQFIQTVRE